jgi:hypothetical protein
MNAIQACGVSFFMRVLLMLVLPGYLAAQAPTEPPPIIQLVRKPGVAPGMLRPYGDARAAINVIGLTAITGLPETWSLEAHYSWTSIEDLDRGLVAAGYRTPETSADLMQDDVLTPSRTMLATFRPGWSYRADQAIRLFPRARYFQVTIYRIRAGTESDFSELIRLRRLSADSVNLDRPDIAYSVISGAPSGTFIFLSPIVSLRAMDEGVANVPAWAEGLFDERRKARNTIAPESQLSREHLLFRVEPRISYVSDGFAGGDEKFWRLKP